MLIEALGTLGRAASCPLRGFAAIVVGASVAVNAIAVAGSLGGEVAPLAGAGPGVWGGELVIGEEGTQAVMIGSIAPATASRNIARRLKGRFDLLSGFISYSFVHWANLWHCRAVLA